MLSFAILDWYFRDRYFKRESKYDDLNGTLIVQVWNKRLRNKNANLSHVSFESDYK